MFTLRTFAILGIYAVVMFAGYRYEKRTSVMKAPLPGLVLPLVAWIVALALSVNNFIIAFSVRFSIYAFGASVALFFFFSVPAIFFSLLYVDGRDTVKLRRMVRDKRTRQVRLQNRVHNDFQRRYEEEKREPLVYRPSGRKPSESLGDNRRSAAGKTTSQRTPANSKKSARKKRNR